MYQGHHPDGSGVQKHSAGATYPFVVFATNDGAGVLHPNGEVEHVSTFTFNDCADRVCCYGAAIDRAEYRASAHRKGRAR